MVFLPHDAPTRFSPHPSPILLPPSLSAFHCSVYLDMVCKPQGTTSFCLACELRVIFPFSNG